MDRFGNNYFDKFSMKGPDLDKENALGKRNYFKDSKPEANGKLESFLKNAKPIDTSEVGEETLEEEMYLQYIRKQRKKIKINESVVIGLKRVKENEYEVKDDIN